MPDNPDYNVALKQLRKRGVATKEFTPEQAQAIADSPGLRKSSRELRAKSEQLFQERPTIKYEDATWAEDIVKSLEKPIRTGFFSKLKRFARDVK